MFLLHCYEKCKIISHLLERKFPLSKKASATATDVNGSIKEATKPQLPNFLCPPPSSPPWPRSALPLSGDEDRDRIGGTLRSRTFQLLVIVEVTNTGEILVRGTGGSLAQISVMRPFDLVMERGGTKLVSSAL